MKYLSLQALGWNNFFEQQSTDITIPGHEVARVVSENKTNYGVRAVDREAIAEITGKLMYGAETESELPKVGEWVVITMMDDDRAMIHEVLKRKTVLSRAAAGRKTTEQVIAANLDVVFIVQGLDDNFNIARLERYLTAVRGIEPVIVLNKADICTDLHSKLTGLRQRISGVDVIATSTLNHDVEALRLKIRAGNTFAFVGSSGVGKSSLINTLLKDDALRVSDVREKDSKGRHTTTRREMIFMENGGILIDTPGMREFQPWGSDDSVGVAFADILGLATGCRYTDCQHLHEDGCAVRLAISEGTVSPSHFENYLKLRRELDYLASRTDINLALERKNAAKRMIKTFNKMVRRKRNED